MKWRILRDVKYNIDGSWQGRREAKAGDVVSDIPNNLIPNFQRTNIIEAAGDYPSNNKVFAPKEQKIRGKASMEHLGAGWYNILDGHGKQVDKIRGKEEAQTKVKELNG